MKHLLFILFILAVSISFGQGYDIWNLEVVSTPFHGFCWSVQVEDNYAFINAGKFLQVIDVTDPYNPEMISEINIGYSSVDLVLCEGFLYMSHDSAGVSIVNVSMPEFPELVSHFYDDFNVNSVSVKDSFLFVCTINDGFRILNIEDPASPLEIYCNPDETIDFKNIEIDHDGEFGFLTINTGGVRVLDISNPHLPIEISVMSDERIECGTMNDEIFFSYPYFKATDVSNPYSLSVLYEDDYMCINNRDWSNVYVDNCYAYICDSIVIIYDISNYEDTMIVVNTIDTYFRASDITIDDNLAYVADWLGMAIYDISNIHDITLVSYLMTSWCIHHDFEYDGYVYGIFNRDYSKTSRLELGNPLDFDRSPEIVLNQGITYPDVYPPYVFRKYGRETSIYDFSDPDMPFITHTAPYYYLTNKWEDDLYIFEYLDFYTVFLEDPSAPVFVDTFDLVNHVINYCIDGDLLLCTYIDSSRDFHFGTFLIENPFSIIELGSVELENTPSYLSYINNTAIVCHLGYGIEIVDYSDPSSLVQYHSYEYDLESLDFYGNVGIAVAESGRMEFYDFSDPLSPEIMAYFYADGGIASYYIQGDYLYAIMFIYMSELMGGETERLFILDISSFFEQTTMDLSRGWNLISYPYEGEYTLDSYFYSIIDPIFSYESVSEEYESVLSLSAGNGYWILGERDTTVYFDALIPVDSLDIKLVRGWNLIGGLSEPLPMTYFTDLPCVPVSGFEYDPESGDYISSDTLRPFKGYWIISTDSVTVHLP